MSKIASDVDTVKSNVMNNRKNMAAQLESLRVQLTTTEATIAEMDSLRALLEVALADPAIVAAAEVKHAENEPVIAKEAADAQLV